MNLTGHQIQYFRLYNTFLVLEILKWLKRAEGKVANNLKSQCKRICMKFFEKWPQNERFFILTSVEHL